jgi:hypothetical protein
MPGATGGAPRSPGATSSADWKNSPARTSMCGCRRQVPAGIALVAAQRALDVGHRDPLRAIFSGSSVTRTTWSGPPSVTTSRVPGTRLSLDLQRVRNLLQIGQAARVRGRSCSVSETIGTSSMPAA